MCEVIYDKFFRMLLFLDWDAKCSRQRIAVFPKVVISDFEIGLIAAAKHWLKAEVSGCYFHLTQNLFRNLKDELGLMVSNWSCLK